MNKYLNMMNKRTYYQIRKTLISQNISVLMNNSLGEVLEFENFDHAKDICIILNVNSDSNCKYELVTIQQNTNK
jgi:hypothetical protein